MAKSTRFTVFAACSTYASCIFLLTLLTPVRADSNYKCPSPETPNYDLDKKCLQSCTLQNGTTIFFPTEVRPAPPIDSCNTCTVSVYIYPDGSTCEGPKACTLMLCPDTTERIDPVTVCDKPDRPHRVGDCIDGCIMPNGTILPFPSQDISVPSKDCNTCSARVFTYPNGKKCQGPAACTKIFCVNSQCGPDATPEYMFRCISGCTLANGTSVPFPSKPISVPSNDCNKCSANLISYPDGSTCKGPTICTLMACSIITTKSSQG